jgi:hypothetical protein
LEQSRFRSAEDRPQKPPETAFRIAFYLRPFFPKNRRFCTNQIKIGKKDVKFLIFL